MSLFYLDKENRVVAIPFGKDGDALRMVNGVPKFVPDSTPPVEPPFVLKVNGGPDFKAKAGAPIILSAVSERAESFSWKIIKSPSQFNPVATFTIIGTGDDKVVDGSICVPGTLILLSGTFRSLAINKLVGTSESPIVIQNNGKVIIGNPAFAGTGAWYGLRMAGCKNFIIDCVNNGDIEISGSTSTAVSPNGGPWKEHYRNIDMTEFTDNFEISGVTSKNGGHGIVAKTDPVKNNAASYNGTPLGYMIFKNMTFSNNQNEAAYIGHTATLWNINTNKPAYPGPSTPNPDPVVYKEPLAISRVIVDNCIATGSGSDGFQISASDDTTVANTEVTDWARLKLGDHQGGILIGGKTKKSAIISCWIHDGWGECVQFYGTGEADNNHVIEGSTIEKNQGDMISIRGIRRSVVTIKNNNILHAGPKGNLIRVNGTINGAGLAAVITNNVLAGPLNNGKGTVYAKNFIYLENGAAVTDTGNHKFNKTTDAPFTLDLSVKDRVGPKQTSSSAVIKSPSAALTEVTGLVPGEYIFEVTAKYQDQTAIDTITVTVE